MSDTPFVLEPMPGKIVVKPDETDQMVSGLYLVRNAKQSIGTIMAVYDDFTDPDTDAEITAFLAVGDTVIFGQHAGAEVTFNRQKFIILREAEILCKVNAPSAIDPSTVRAE